MRIYDITAADRRGPGLAVILDEQASELLAALQAGVDEGSGRSTCGASMSSRTRRTACLAPRSAGSSGGHRTRCDVIKWRDVYTVARGQPSTLPRTPPRSSQRMVHKGS